MNAPSARPRLPAWAAPAAVAALMVALRLHNVTAPLVDTSDWRQTDTAAVAWFYFHKGIALLHPQLWHDGPGPDYTQLELQITPAIAALAAHVFGYSDTLLHVVAIAVDTASLPPLWALARRRMGTAAANWTALIYACLPLGIFFGRAFQPEPMMLLTGNLALWACDGFGRRRGALRYAGAVIALAFAVLAKLPNGLVLVPAVVLAAGPGPGDWRRLLRPRQWPWAAGLVVIPAAAGAAYTMLQGEVAAHGTLYVNFIVSSLAGGFLAGEPSVWRFLWQEVLGMAVTPAGVIACAIGVAALLRRPGGAWIAAWGAAVAIYAAVVLRDIRLQYYLMPVLPLVAVVAGLGLDAAVRWWPSRARGQAAAGLLTAALLAGGLVQIRGYWPPYWPWYRLGVDLNATLPASATVVIGGSFNPTILYYARRHGWRIDPITPRNVTSMADLGADYLVPAAPVNACTAAYLGSHYAGLQVGGETVYDLRHPLRVPAGASGCTANGKA